MTDTTTRLSLPLIAEAQAQKHVTHNEGLLMLDALVQAAVKDRDLTTPPATPAEGEAWIVAAGATDAWSGQDDAIAVWQNGAWRFFAPAPGWRVWIEDEGLLAVWDGSAWIRASRGVASLNPVDGGMVGINTTADATNRLAVKSDAVLFSHDDVSGSGSGDVRFTVNKAAPANTASLLFQDAWSGRAELGLAGDDDFRIKVSPDGATWHESIVVDRNTGWVRFPSGGVREPLRGHRSYYVSPDGSDAADGLSPATALRTVQEAVRRCYRLDSNGYTVTIRLLPGVHEGNVVVDRRIVGDARLAIVGETADPDQVVLRATIATSTIRALSGARVRVANMRIENDLRWSLLFADAAADLEYENIVFAACSRDHVEARANSIVTMRGDCRIVGGARAHINFTNGSVYLAVNRTVTVENTPHFSTAFAWFQRGAHYSIWNVAWSGAATGQRYLVRSNATCNGPTDDHFPGDTPGVADTGGYYGPA